MFLKIADGGHFGFRGDDGHKRILNFANFNYVPAIFFSKSIWHVKSIEKQSFEQNGHGFKENDSTMVILLGIMMFIFTLTLTILSFSASLIQRFQVIVSVLFVNSLAVYLTLTPGCLKICCR